MDTVYRSRSVTISARTGSSTRVQPTHLYFGAYRRRRRHGGRGRRAITLAPLAVWPGRPAVRPGQPAWAAALVCGPFSWPGLAGCARRQRPGAGAAGQTEAARPTPAPDAATRAGNELCSAVRRRNAPAAPGGDWSPARPLAA